MSANVAGDETIEIFQPQVVAFGGEERVILALARALTTRGRKVRFLCYSDSVGLAAHADFPLEVLALVPSGVPRDRARALASHLAIRHAAGAPVPMLCNIQSAYHAGYAVRTPYHLRIPDTFRLLTQSTPRRSVARLKRWYVDHLVGRGISAARSFTTNTCELSKEMGALYGRVPEVVPLGGIAPSEAVPAKQVDGSVRILSVSRLEDSKRVDWILNALAALPVEGVPTWLFEVIGTGPAREFLESRAEELGIADRVTFHGFVTDEALKAAFGRAHLFAMPAVQGYGIPAIEAVSHRLVVVLTTASGVYEVLAGTGWAIVTAPTPDAFRVGLSEAVQRVATTNLLTAPLPALPTEAGWAARMIDLAGW